MGEDRRWLAIAAALMAVAAAVLPFLYLHFTGNGTLFLVLAPLALVLAVVSIVIGIRSRPKSVPVVVVAALVAALALWMIIGLTLFVLSCNNVIHAGNC